MFVKDVFRIIADRLNGRAADIRIFVESDRSFEEWCNWEAFLACKAAGLDVVARPAYSALGSPDSRQLADLLISSRDGAHRVVVELGHAHDYTGYKWIAKLDADAEKLRLATDVGVSRLQIILVATVKYQLAADQWQSWLKKMRCWNCPPDMEVRHSLPGGGEMLARGWLIG